jgi:hypothetical protein
MTLNTSCEIKWVGPQMTNIACLHLHELFKADSRVMYILFGGEFKDLNVKVKIIQLSKENRNVNLHTLR